MVVSPKDSATLGALSTALVLLVGCAQPTSPEELPTLAPNTTADVSERFEALLNPRSDEPYPTEPEARVDIPAIYGGTLLATRDGEHLVAADPARDTLTVVRSDLSELRRVDLEPGAEPFRAAEDGAGAVHVVLRGTGELLSLDATLTSVVRKQQVCPAPRGIAYDSASDELLVACKGGELVAFAPDGRETARVFVDTDLRDVVIAAGVRYVTRFRSAELLALGPDGTIVSRRRPAHAVQRREGEEPRDMTPNVAWRTRGLSDGSVLMLHQRSAASPVPLANLEDGETGYGVQQDDSESGCIEPIVQTSVTHFAARPELAPRNGPMLGNVGLAVDLVVDEANGRFAVASPRGNVGGEATFDIPHVGGSSGRRSMSETTVFSLRAARTEITNTQCLLPISRTDGGSALAWLDEGLFIQQREPARLARSVDGELRSWVFVDSRTALASPGHELFHQVTPLALACASCHPEGDEDGHTWFFDDDPGHRTQTMRGGILQTMPFHWRGDVPDMRAVLATTFTDRMGGSSADEDEVTALEHWVDQLPAFPPPALDAAKVSAGEALFVESGCTDCHSGGTFTNDETVAVHDGAEPLQVPLLLGVGHRAPYFHDGCAQSLNETFDGTCSPGHVPARTLDALEADQLTTYLRSL